MAPPGIPRWGSCLSSNPTYTHEQIDEILSRTKTCRGLDGKEFRPGLVGLNNLKMTDYLSAVVQLLVRIPELCRYYMSPFEYSRVQAFFRAPSHSAVLVENLQAGHKQMCSPPIHKKRTSHFACHFSPPPPVSPIRVKWQCKKNNLIWGAKVSNKCHLAAWPVVQT